MNHEFECPVCMVQKQSAPRISICGNHELCIQCYSQIVMHNTDDLQSCPVCRTKIPVSIEKIRPHQILPQYEYRHYYDARYIARQHGDVREVFDIIVKKYGKIRPSEQTINRIIEKHICQLYLQIEMNGIPTTGSYQRYSYNSELRRDIMSVILHVRKNDIHNIDNA